VSHKVAAEWVQYLGVAATMGFAAMVAVISRQARAYHRYGREALLCSAVLIFATATIRGLSVAGAVDSATARSCVGLVSVCCLAILAQIALLRRKEHRLQTTDRRETPC